MNNRRRLHNTIKNIQIKIADRLCTAFQNINITIYIFTKKKKIEENADKIKNHYS